MIGTYGANYLRSVSEIRPFPRISPPFVRQEDSQGSPGSNYQASRCVVDQRAIAQEIPQTSPNKTRSQRAINRLTINKRIRIITIVSGIQCSAFLLFISGIQHSLKFVMGVYGKR